MKFRSKNSLNTVIVGFTVVIFLIIIVSISISPISPIPVISRLLAAVNFSFSPSPTVTLTATPTIVSSGGYTTLTWTSTNATSCSGSNNENVPYWNGTLNSVNGSGSLGPLTASTEFKIVCSNASGMSQSARVTVTPSTAWTQLGLGEPIINNTFPPNSWDINTQLNKIIALQPKIFRFWLDGNNLYDSNGKATTTYIPLYQTALNRLNSAGIKIMGMDNNFPSWMTGADSTVSANWNAIPCPGTTQYSQFLTKYGAYWTRMATLFPQILYWEPANETNGSIRPIQSGSGSCGETAFSHNQLVMITIQLMQYAHQAIHNALPNAIVMMPPPSPLGDSSLQTIGQFISDIYSAIASWNGNPRSYFDGISWHPYIFSDATTASWVVPNESIYNVIKAHGDGSIPIIFSEVGNSDTENSQSVLANWMQDTILLTQKEMPWVKYIVWFRAFDDPSALIWGAKSGKSEATFGIMKDNYPTFSSKSSANTFCKFTGCISEPFRAYNTESGWSTFQYNQPNNSYCKYTSPSQFTTITGLNYTSTLPWLATLDTSRMTFKGNCF